MNQPLDDLHCNPGLPATARIILMYLSTFPAGARVEEIAVNTGSKYRWAEATVLRLHREGLLLRVGPNTYALNVDASRDAVQA